MRIAIIFFIIFFCIPAIGISATINIPADYPTIQQGIDAAVNGDTVLVAPGTYVENIDFKGKAITVISDQGPVLTVIDGGNPINPDYGSVVLFNSGEGLDSVLEGFKVTNGTGTLFEQDPGWWVHLGGGIFCNNSSPTINKNTFSQNSAFCGGGMFNNISSPTVSKCNFIGNTVLSGGGMYNEDSSPTVTNCTFSGNEGMDGGGMENLYSSPTVTNCIFIGNSGTYWGGAGMCNWDSSPIMTSCIFIGNSAFRGGGGVYNSDSSPTVTSCAFFGNSAFHGGGMCYENSGNPTVTNCTFSGNLGDIEGGGMLNVYCSLTVTNCILWNNTPDEIIGPATVTYSDVKGGYPGTGNIDSDPLFIDPDNGDFHLNFQSYCRDSGNNSAVTEPTDFEGDPRIAYGTVDMGADEIYTHLYWTGDATPGGNVEIKFVGLPGTAPVGLCIGTGVLDPPLKSMWGDWYLKFPILGPVGMPPISSTGVSIVPGTIPSTYPSPVSIPMQALIGAELTNLSILEVR